MIPKTAIEKAIEGKWKPPSSVSAEGLLRDFEWQIFALDPLFFQALGKALGWDNRPLEDADYQLAAEVNVRWIPMFDTKGRPLMQTIQRGQEENLMRYRMEQAIIEIEERGWKYEAKRFYDLILTNQSTEAFWSELLASPTNKI